MLCAEIVLRDREKRLRMLCSAESMQRAHQSSPGQALTLVRGRGHGKCNEDVSLIVRDKRGGCRDAIANDNL